MPSLGFGEMVTKCEGVNVLVCMCVHVCMHACDVQPMLLQSKLTAKGADLTHALLDYIRNNDVAILEGCEKVCNSHTN